MSGAEDFIAAIRNSRGSQPLSIAVGRVRIIPATSTSAAVAVVEGITETALRVTAESWCSPFAASVVAGSVNNRLVVVLFNAGQPMILCLIGV